MGLRCEALAPQSPISSRCELKKNLDTFRLCLKSHQPIQWNQAHFSLTLISQIVPSILRPLPKETLQLHVLLKSVQRVLMISNEMFLTWSGCLTIRSRLLAQELQLPQKHQRHKSSQGQAHAPHGVKRRSVALTWKTTSLQNKWRKSRFLEVEGP